MRLCLALLAALVLVSGLSGCGRLLGSRYDNFTAYYNTFYNAREAFEREEKTLLDREQPVDRDRFLGLFAEPPEQGTPPPGFQQAIEKGADLLREYPESKWVDDALLLIGKAYFYQGNFAGAEQKFNEVIALDVDQLEDEARLWLGRTLTASESYDEAALALREGLDREGIRERWAAPMRLALAEVDVRRGDWEAAVEALQAGLDGVRDDEMAARAAFLLGQIYEVLDRPADAADAYARALSFGPRYELAYAAQLSQALALGLHGETDRSLDLLRRMTRDDKHFQNFAEVELARARVLAAAGRPGEARALLLDLLYDPASRAGSIRGPVHYRLAEVYREGLEDYVRAAAHYDTSATVLRQPALSDTRFTREAITDAPSRAGNFGSYARVVGEIAEMDSLLYLGSLDDDAFAEAVEAVRQQREREATEQEREMARRRAEQGFQGGGPDGFGQTGTRPEEGNPIAGDTGFLSFRDPVRVQEQLIGFQARWGDRPLALNWRRADAIGGEVEVAAGIAETIENVPGGQVPAAVAGGLVDVSAVPRDPLARQQMRTERAAARYELGNVLFLALGEPATAAPWYRLVIEEDSESAVAQRAYFALAETQRALGNEAEANALYEEVLDRYPETALADQARVQLGLAERERIVVADSLSEAEAAYSLAYERWQDGGYADALDAMLRIGEEYPTTPVAARARLAAGALYTEWAAGDSTALLAPLPQVIAADVALNLPADTVNVAATEVVADTTVGRPLPPPPLSEADLALVLPEDDFGIADASAADSSAALRPAAEYEEPWLYALYASIEEDYPGTRYAERARAIRVALTEEYPRAAAPQGSDAGIAADSLGAPEEAPATVTAGPEDAPGAEGLRGGSAVRADQGGYTWIVFSAPARLEVEPVVLDLADLGYQAALYLERGAEGIVFHALVGQFATEEEAEAARAALPQVQGAAAPRLLPLEGITRGLQPPRALSQRNNQ